MEKVLLCALTGFGNKVLDALLGESCEVVAVFTRKERGPFPYYPEENLRVHCEKNQVPVYERFSWGLMEKIITKHNPRLLLVATFHKIIPREVLDLVPLIVNLHPSLLPKYKGRLPIEAALANKERETGITAHLITEEVDSGPILFQIKMPIESDDNVGSLRRKLAEVAGKAVRRIIGGMQESH